MTAFTHLEEIALQKLRCIEISGEIVDSDAQWDLAHLQTFGKKVVCCAEGRNKGSSLRGTVEGRVR